MKDKRQRIAMTWPYGIADPAVYAYLMNAAAASLSQYPYSAAGGGASSLPSPHHAGGPPPPFNYYASVGLQRAAAAYGNPLPPPPAALHQLHHPGMMTSSLPQHITGNDVILSNISGQLLRAAAGAGMLEPSGMTTSASTPPTAMSANAALHAGPHPGLFATAAVPRDRHLQATVCGHVPGICTAAFTGEPCACHLLFGGAKLPHLQTSSSSSSRTTTIHVTSSKPEFVSATLFQPYKKDVERA